MVILVGWAYGDPGGWVFLMSEVFLYKAVKAWPMTTSMTTPPHVVDNTFGDTTP